jgi:hypothetical protein
MTETILSKDFLPFPPVNPLFACKATKINHLKLNAFVIFVIQRWIILQQHQLKADIQD